MPIQYLQVMDQLRNKLPRLEMHRKDLEASIAKAREAFETWKETPEALWERVVEAAQKDPNLRCAVPFSEEDALDARFPPPERPSLETLVMLASDGSHIMPDRHSPLFYGLVNIAVLLLTYEAFWKRVDTRIYLEDDFPSHLAPESYVRQERMAQEHALLARVAGHVRGFPEDSLQTQDWPVLSSEQQPVALLDGPLEVWGVAEQEYHRLVGRLVPHWQRLHRAGVPLAGYVDRPRADLVVRMLAVAQGHADSRTSPWPGVLDGHLFRPLLPPGWRSTLFRIHSSGMQQFPEDYKVAFFYLNVGTETRPLLARVEIPVWVAREPELVIRVHRAVWWNVQQSGSVRYPYLLHRAHQEAVVTYRDREELERLLQRAWMEAGIPLVGPSEKQRLKNQDVRR